MIPAGFEPTACRLGGDRSILLSYGTMFSKALFFQASEDSVMFIVSFGVVLLIRKVDY